MACPFLDPHKGASAILLFHRPGGEVDEGFGHVQSTILARSGRMADRGILVAGKARGNSHCGPGGEATKTNAAYMFIEGQFCALYTKHSNLFRSIRAHSRAGFHPISKSLDNV